MKKIVSLLPLLALLLYTEGCASFEKNAGKTLASIASSVDAGMKGWAAYVVSGKSTPDQEAKVKVAYQQYQLSMSIAKDAYVASAQSGDRSVYDVAVTTLFAEQSKLLALLQSFGVAVANPANKKG